MPGTIATGLVRHMAPAWFRDQMDIMAMNTKTPEQDAAASVRLAAAPLVDGVTGRYFEDINEAEAVTERGDGGSGIALYALDSANAERL